MLSKSRLTFPFRALDWDLLTRGSSQAKKTHKVGQCKTRQLATSPDFALNSVVYLFIYLFRSVVCFFCLFAIRDSVSWALLWHFRSAAKAEIDFYK